MFKIFFATTFFLLGVYLSVFISPLAFAQTPCQVTGAGEESFADGLITAGGGITGKVDSATGACVVDPAAKYASYELPKNYEALKNSYYLRAKPISTTTRNSATADTNQSGIRNLGTKDQIYNFTGNFNITGPITGTKTGVIFIDGNLGINTNIDYPSPTGGLIFVVKGSVFIDSSVTNVAAVIISFGNICTSSRPPATCLDVPTTAPFNSQLIVDGSFTSLDKSKPILFRRSLRDNREAAELIRQQPKFLVLLKDIFSETLEIRNEY